MTTKTTWRQRSRNARDEQSENELLAEILSAGEKQVKKLGQVIWDESGSSICRVAATQTLARLQGAKALPLLRELLDPQKVRDPDVRYMALQWLTDLLAENRTALAEVKEIGLRDPSQLVSWVAQTTRIDPEPSRG